MSTTEKTPSIFITYKNQIDLLVQSSIAQMGEKTPLRDAVEYALTNGGKRFRPMIVQMISEALDNGLNVDSMALAVEFFHTASLIADDLPCMDNDEQRRSKPSLHKAFPESAAILASYTLISMGYEKISENTKRLIEDGVSEEKANLICRKALDVVTHCAGIFGATTGQYLDLFPPDHSVETLEKIIYQKTVTLFEISFVCGWLFSGGDLEKISDLTSVAYDFGMAFQIADDLGDLAQDKSHANESNIAYQMGKDHALKVFQGHIHALEGKLKDLQLWSDAFKELFYSLKGLAG